MENQHPNEVQATQCSKCIWQTRYDRELEERGYYRAKRSELLQQIENNHIVIRRTITSHEGPVVVLECWKRGPGLGRQFRVLCERRCIQPGCRNHRWVEHTVRPNLSSATFLPQCLDSDLTTDHLCHFGSSSVGNDSGCVNPNHLDQTSLAVNKSRMGCPGHWHCKHTNLGHRACLMPGPYSGNLANEDTEEIE